MFDPASRILVVDDMKTMRKLVQRACQQIGFKEFVEAEDGVLAWKILNEQDSNIKIIISDWNMPNCTGIDLLKRVRADGRTKALPFILLTAESEITQVQAALAAGVDSYLVKPFTADAIAKKLKQIYQKRAAA